MRIEREDEGLFHQDHPHTNGSHHEKEVGGGATELPAGKTPATTLQETEVSEESDKSGDGTVLTEEGISASDSSSSSEDCLTCSCSSSSSSSSSCCSSEDGDGEHRDSCHSPSESDSDATITNDPAENDDDVELEPEQGDKEVGSVHDVRGTIVDSIECVGSVGRSNVVEWSSEIDRAGNGHAPGETGISTQDYPAEDLDPLSVSFSVPVPSARPFSYIHSPTSSEESDDSDSDSKTESSKGNSNSHRPPIISSNIRNGSRTTDEGKKNFTFSYNYTYSFSCASEEDELDDEEKADSPVNSKLLNSNKKSSSQSVTSISNLQPEKGVTSDKEKVSSSPSVVSVITKFTKKDVKNSPDSNKKRVLNNKTRKDRRTSGLEEEAKPLSTSPDGESGFRGKVRDDNDDDDWNNNNSRKPRASGTVVGNRSVSFRDSPDSSPVSSSRPQTTPLPRVPQDFKSAGRERQPRGHGQSAIPSVHCDNTILVHPGQVSPSSSVSAPTTGTQNAIIPFFNGFPLLNTPYKESPPPPPQKFADSTSSEMHQRLSGDPRLRSLLKKPGQPKKQRGRNVTFNESLNLFYEAECSCWIHEDDYARLRQEEQQYLIEQQQQFQQQQQHHHHSNQHQHSHSHSRRDDIFHYEPPPIEFEDPPTLSPPEGYKDRFFPQDPDPDVTRVSPPSPPAARRKVFLKENPTVVSVNGVETAEDEEDDTKKNKGSRLGGILKGGRLWRSNSADGKKVTSPPEEPDVVKCTERDRDRDREREREEVGPIQNASSPSSHQNQVQILEEPQTQYQVQQSTLPSKVSTGTAPLRTSEQIRLAVDSTLRHRTKRNKPECSSLVEKLRWLTSLDDEDSDSNQSGFATWPSREKNGPTTTNKKSDAGTSTSEEFVQASLRTPPSTNEAKIKQISYTLEDIDEGLKGNENELETFITEDGGRIERLRKRYGEEGADDYGFSRRPSVKGIKPKFSSTNQIFAQFTAMRKQCETPIPMESQYENTRIAYDHLQQNSLNQVDGARILNYEFQNAPGRQSDESRAHFEMIRQSFEQANFVNFNRPHSWSVSTLPHPHSHSHSHSHSIAMGSTSPAPPSSLSMAPNNLSGSTMSVNNPNASQLSHHNSLVGASGSAVPTNMQNNSQQIPPSNQMGMMPTSIAAPPHHNIYGTLPTQSQQQAQQQQQIQQQPIYGTVRRVPNVIGRPLFLHYGALSVEAHPNKIVQPYPRTKVPETPSPTQQPPPIRYYGPPIRYYNPPPPVPPRSVTTTIGSGQGIPMNIADCLERGVPEGATDEEPSLKEPYSMNV